MILTVGNTKGGVGKSTIAANLAVEAAIEGKRVMLIDSDIQGSTLAFRAVREKDDIKAMAITTPTLHKDIKDLKGFDIIVIDAGGRDSAVFRSSILSCDLMIIPVLPSQYDIWATNDTLEMLKEARAFKDIEAYFAMNQVIPNTIVSRDAMKAIREFKDGIKLLKSLLHARVAFKNSIAQGKGVSEYERSGKAAKEIKGLYKEIIDLLEVSK